MGAQTRVERPGAQRRPDLEARDSLPETAALPDRFVVEGVLGRGGMGVVVRARDQTLGREVAVKILSAKLQRDDELRGRLVREARAAASLRHPNVVEVYDVDPDAAFLVMELVEGRSLSRVLSDDGPLAAAEVRRIGDALLDALAAAHARGIVHRDVKPSNVLLTPEGLVKLTDFGIAFVEEGERTRDGLFFGTPGYMSPEQAHGRVDARSDVYSVGATLFELATGQRVHTQERSVEDVRGAVVEATSDAALADAIAVALMHRGVDRHADAAAFRAALARRSPEDSGWGWLRARPKLVAGVCGLSLALGAAAGFAWERPAQAGAPPVASPARVEAPPRDGPRAVAIVPFRNLTGSEHLDFTSVGLQQLLGLELRAVTGLRVIPSYRVPAPEDPTVEGWRSAAAGSGADAIVEGSVERAGDGMEIHVAVFSAAGEPLTQLRAEVTEEELGNTLRGWVGPIGSAIIGRSVVVVAAPRVVGFDRELQLGVSALEQHNLSQALEHLERALEIDPDSANARYYLTIASWWAGRPVEVVRTHLGAAREGELDASRRAVLDGIERIMSGELTAAIESLEESAREHPLDRDILYGLFEAQFHGGNPADAVQTYERVLEADPSFRLGSLHLVDYFGSRGDIERTRWAVGLAAQRQGGASQLRGRMANVSRDWPALVAELTQAIEERPSGPLLGQLVGAYLLSGNLTLARAYASRVTRDLPALGAEIRFALDVLRARDAPRHDAFRRALEVIGRIQNTHARYFQMLTLAEIALPRARRDEAERLEEIFGTAVPTDLATDSRTAIVRLMAAEARGDREAVDAARRSSHPEVAALAAGMQASADDRHTEAAAHFAEAADRSGDGRFRPMALDRLAQARRALGEHGEVISVCRDLIDPPTFRWSWVATARDCLAWSAEAHEARSEPELAEAARARLAQLSR